MKSSGGILFLAVFVGVGILVYKSFKG